MLYGWAAGAVVTFHFAFILFALGGAALLFVWPRLVWLHLPALAWGGFVEFTSRICPLTMLEDRLRDAAGQAGYAGGFIDHYLTPIVYPAGLTPATQLVFGSVLVGVNILLYGALAWRAASRLPERRKERDTEQRRGADRNRLREVADIKQIGRAGGDCTEQGQPPEEARDRHDALHAMT